MDPQAVSATNANAPTIAAPEEHYRSATPRSRETWARAAKLFPQGVSGQAKYFAPYPVFVASAKGATVTDVDGRDYVDLLMGAGPMLLGHSHPRVVEAIQRQAAFMTTPMMPTRLSLEYAERLHGHMPYLERLRFVNTGSEATRSAVRVARAVTGRLRIAKFEGNYHGSDDFALVSTHSRQALGPDDLPAPQIDYAGIPPRLADEVLVLPYNDAEAASRAIEEAGSELAAVIMEPVSFSSGGGVPAEPGFVRAVRESTRRHGVALIFDEVLTALRLGLGGAPEYLGVTPDLSTIGKAVGGGLPLAAFGGREDLMEMALGAESGTRRIFQSGTFTENPLSIAAGMAALTVLETEPALARADEAGEQLRVGLRQILDGRGIRAAVTGVGSIIQLHIGTSEVRNRRDVLKADHEATRRLLLGMVAEGVLWPPVHPAVTSAAHTSTHVDQVLAAFERVLDQFHVVNAGVSEA